MQNYTIHLDESDQFHLSDLIKKTYQDDMIFVVTDEKVDQFYHQKLVDHLFDFELSFVVIKPGETSKSFSTYQEVISKLIKQGMRRNHLLIAFGGGVVGDLCGFVASTLYRGVKFIQVPTTLLAMVDSSIGGKVGIDLEEGKNLVGAFYQPLFVYINQSFLNTLDIREYRNGLAEMIKAGLIGDKHLYHYLQKEDHVTISEIQMAIQVKRNLVLIDPFDHHERMYLNFGHTFGHAIELKHQYTTYKHGEAISYGMLIALEIGISKGETPKYLYDEVKDMLLRLELIKEPLLSKEDYLEYIKKDKKFVNSTLKFIVIPKVGQAKHIDIKASDLL